MQWNAVCKCPAEGDMDVFHKQAAFNAHQGLGAMWCSLCGKLCDTCDHHTLVAVTPDLRNWGTLLGPLGTLMSPWLAG